MWSNADDVIYISFPKCWLYREATTKFGLEILHENISQDTSQRGAHSDTKSLLIKRTIKRENSGSTTKFNKFNKNINGDAIWETKAATIHQLPSKKTCNIIKWYISKKGFNIKT